MTNCCDANGQCNQGFGCPARSTVLTPADSDELIVRDFIKGAVCALAGVALVAIGTAVYFFN